MELNNIIFPRPKPTYKYEFYKEEMLFIPKDDSFSYNDVYKYRSKNSHISYPHNFINKFEEVKKPFDENETDEEFLINKTPNLSLRHNNKFIEIPTNKKDYIPCILIKNNNSNELIIYFHANSEDIGSCYNTCYNISRLLIINVLIVEYPGYGIYKSDKCTEKMILKDSQILYNFLSNIMNFEESNIIIMGRCIGSGPATSLAANYNPKALILISPFTSLKKGVKSILDKVKMGWLSKFVEERFNNIENIPNVSCPTLFIHGKNDDVIPWEHSLELIKMCKCPAKLITPNDMNHCFSNIIKNLIDPLKGFFKDLEYINQDEIQEEICKIKFPSFMYSNPFDI